GNKIFKKGKSDVLTFKNKLENSNTKIPNSKMRVTLSEVEVPKPKIKISKTKKIFIGKGTHFFPKSNVGQFLIEEDELNIGDKVLIKGTTTGNQEMVLQDFFVNGKIVVKAIAGENITLKLPFRIRLSDRLYKIQN
ncbi:MAG: sulfurtransferase, partial [Flavobacterium sp.]|nr:sulfurtransferase [Flavobacterium sp.]